MTSSKNATVFTRNLANINCLTTHLVEVNETFTPVLSSRVNLTDYATKLHSSAERVEAWNGERLIGLVAFYCNHESAYVSSVSVLPSWRRQGLARKMMRHCLIVVSEHQISSISLQASCQDPPAISLYRSLGFEIQGESASQYQMKLNLPLTDGSLTI